MAFEVATIFKYLEMNQVDSFNILLLYKIPTNSVI